MADALIERTIRHDAGAQWLGTPVVDPPDQWWAVPAQLRNSFMATS